MSLIKHNGLVLDERFLEALRNSGLDGFSNLMDYKGGTIFKKKETRSVVRIEAGEGAEKKVFYLKRHYLTRRESFGRIYPFGFVEDARNEWERMIELGDLGIPTMTPAAYGEAKMYGLPRVSLTLTEEIKDSVRVENYLPTLSSGIMGMAGVAEKRGIIRRLAALARDFHSKGFNHQDFYLCHFFIRPKTGELFIVDLQRVQKRKAVPERWIVKDLAQFVVSAKGISNFTRTDLARFGLAYLGKKTFDAADRALMKKIFSKVKKIAAHDEKLRERRRRAGG